MSNPRYDRLKNAKKLKGWDNSKKKELLEQHGGILMSKKSQSHYHELVQNILWTFINQKDISKIEEQVNEVRKELNLPPLEIWFSGTARKPEYVSIVPFI